MKKLLPALLLLAFGNSHISGQNYQGGRENRKEMKAGHFYGKVIDSANNKGVEFASVQLIGSVFDTVTKTMKKEVVAAGQLTRENGDFSLDNINTMGKYRLKISAMGYAVREIPVSFNFDTVRRITDSVPFVGEKMKSGGGMRMFNAIDKDLGNLKIQPQSTQLNAVEIISTTPVMELKLDKKVFNVEKNMIASGGTAEDALRQIPSVSVDMDGNVSLRNASPQLFVDGKSTTLTMDQIPADAIQSVEVITNPSAKYDASGGQGGILNIVLKKDKRIGYNGNVRAGIDRRGKASGGGDINLREGKLNAFLSGHINRRYSVTEGTTERKNFTLAGISPGPLTTISQDNYSINGGLFAHMRGGMDWFMDNRNTFTFSGNLMAGKFQPTEELNTRTDTIYPSYANSTSYHRVSETERKFLNKGASIRYKHLYPKEGKELTADVNYNKSSFTGRGAYETNYLNASGNPSGTNLLQNMASKGYTEIINAQSDYTHPLSEKSKIETGVRGAYRNFLSKTDNFLKNDSTDIFELVKNQSANFKFNDQVYAAYLIYSNQKDKFSYQLGLRGERSFYTGELMDSNQTFKNYFPVSPFPSASATYDLNGKDNFQLSYSRRINRPTFFQLIPFTDYSDSLNLKRGNAALKPEFTHSLELSYLKVINIQNNILVTGYFKTSTGIITTYQFSEYDTAHGRNAIISTYKNANASYVYGGEFTGKHSLKRWLEFTINVNAYYSILDAKNIEANLTNEQFSWFAKGGFTIKLPKNFSIQLSPEYHSETAVPLNTGSEGRGGGWSGGTTATAQGYVKAKYQVDGAIKYEFLKNKAASITLNIRDIFASDINETVTESDYFNQTSSRLRDPRIVRINFSYRFGKFDASLFKRKNTKENTDEMEIGM